MRRRKLTLRLIFCLALIFTTGTVMSEENASQLPVRIMPLGDSITEGRKAQQSYRYWLVKELEDELFFDFVGSKSGHYGFSLFAKSSYDDDHEGHWGWTTGQVLKKLPLWLQQSHPDAVLVHLGTNDLGRAGGTKQAIQNIEDIVALFRKKNETIFIFLAQIIPVSGGEKTVAKFNKDISQLANALSTSKSPVVVVDQFTGFEPGKHTYDGVHPNATGAKRMAKKWAKALREVFP